MIGKIRGTWCARTRGLHRRHRALPLRTSLPISRTGLRLQKAWPEVRGVTQAQKSTTINYQPAKSANPLVCHDCPRLGGRFTHAPCETRELQLVRGVRRPRTLCLDTLRDGHKICCGIPSRGTERLISQCNLSALRPRGSLRHRPSRLASACTGVGGSQSQPSCTLPRTNQPISLWSKQHTSKR
jgi:hypothetical protein